VPELVLEHDGHLLRVLLEQPAGDAHARRAGGELDEEVMRAWKPGAGDLGQHLADDAAQRVLGKDVVADEILGHQCRFAPSALTSSARKTKVEASVARCLRTPPDGC